MTLVDFIYQVGFYAFITAAVTAWLLYRRLMSGAKTVIRVKMGGNMEKTFDAVEVGRELRWIQDGEEMHADIPVSPVGDDGNKKEEEEEAELPPGGIFAPEYAERWGLWYRVWSIIDGADTVLPLPWSSPEIIAKYAQGDAAAKERWRKRIRALNAFKQLTAGLSSLNRWQAAALVLLGFFGGLYFAPFLTALLGG